MFRSTGVAVRRWFDRLPIHQKMVATALAVTTITLVLATAGLGLVDLWRFRESATSDTTAIARVLSENLAAAVKSNDVKSAQLALTTVHDRDGVRRACIYLSDRTLFTGLSRTPNLACGPSPAVRLPLDVVRGAAPINFDGETMATLYIERDLTGLTSRVMLTLLTGGAMLVIAVALGYVLSWRFNRAVSAPIVQFAKAARLFGREGRYDLPPMPAAEDELGELAHAFSDMATRVRDARDDLVAANQSLMREIDERCRIESERETLLAREREASRLKDEFLTAVSHELRTPLNAIVGWVQILAERKPDDETLAKAVASLARNAQAQTKVIQDLIDVSRMVTGKLRLHTEPVDLCGIVHAAAGIALPSATAKHVALDEDVPQVVCLVQGDRDRLQQVVWNLLSNSVKFTPAGGQVAVRLRPAAPGYDIQVSDTGVGIDPQFLPRVFDRFLQADGSMARQHGGLGLGLAIVKELTELHGGTVTVESEGLGTGATFTVHLPSLDPEDARAGEPHRAHPADA